MATFTHHRRFWNKVQHRLETHPVAHLTGFLACCVVAFLISIPLPRVDGQLIGSDGIYLHGLYLWHPVLLFATGGLVLLYRRDRSLTLLLVLMFAAQLSMLTAKMAIANLFGEGHDLWAVNTEPSYYE